jgi:hypothetical protein
MKETAVPPVPGTVGSSISARRKTSAMVARLVARTFPVRLANVRGLISSFLAS